MTGKISSLADRDRREKVNGLSDEKAGSPKVLSRCPKADSYDLSHHPGGSWTKSVTYPEVLQTDIAKTSIVHDWYENPTTSSIDLAPFPGLLLQQSSNPLLSPSGTSVEKAILSSFEFPNMSYRHEAVASAHARTFEWIFDDSDGNQTPWDNFSEWLQHRNHVYWITGKAASGKSTLMKYILEQRRLRKFLQNWAGNAQLVCAKFYFWHLGSCMQRSQAGLLRSLLHQIFSQCGDLIPRHLPRLWRQAVFHPRLYSYLPVNTVADYCAFDDEYPLSYERNCDVGSTTVSKSIDNAKSIHCRKGTRQNKQLIFTDQYLEKLGENWYPWSLAQLITLFEEVIKQTVIPIRFCFFVDGLDEFDGDHSEIAALFHRVAAVSNVKVVLSSRPLLVFEHEFESYPRLRVQDLTKNDIRIYAHDNLSTHKRVLELSKREPDLLSQLTSKVLEMSSGVFLWVTLAIRSLLSGLTNLDNITDLQRGLYELPPELDDLFSKMLLAVKPEFYRGQAARLFQVVYQSISPMSALALSFADEIPQGPALWINPKPVGILEAAQHVKIISARLKSRCAGLLDVCWDGNTG